MYKLHRVCLANVSRTALFLGLVALSTAGCNGTLPSARIAQDVLLPVPASAQTLPTPERLSSEDRGVSYTITPRALIPLAFHLQPDIKSSFRRFRSEEARYDFFYASRDSLTPRMVVSNDISEARTRSENDRGHYTTDVTRSRTHTVEVSVEKQFFDTTRLDLAAGFRTDDVDDDIGNAPFLSASLRYPLAASREKLERTSEDIFRRNELDDAQLAYIQEIRRRLQRAMFRFYEVVDLDRRVTYYDAWIEDLEAIGTRLGEVQRDTTVDASRLEAETTRVSASRRNTFGRFQVELTRLKSSIGVPFHATFELVDEPFNPFAGRLHDDVLTRSIETDPEIATLRNAVRNAEVQLDLARRGTWDVALLLAGDSNIEGRGFLEGTSDWSASVGLDVSAVDARVTDSLSRQAQANIARFQQAISARENDIFADTYEPLIRIETLSASYDDLLANLPRFESDFRDGVEAYVNGTLNIDDLLKRRELWFEQQQETSRLKFLVGANVAELCAATGKFFELLGDETAP